MHIASVFIDPLVISISCCLDVLFECGRTECGRTRGLQETCACSIYNIYIYNDPKVDRIQFCRGVLFFLKKNRVFDPNTKIIYSDPIDRIFSIYSRMLKNVVSFLSFSDLLEFQIFLSKQLQKSTLDDEFWDSYSSHFPFFSHFSIQKHSIVN